MAKIGRNDPCPCGSGKKYKRCCLTEAVPPDFTQDDRRSALGRLEGFVENELGPEDDEAYDSFYARWDDLIEELDATWVEQSEAVYDMWLYLDYRLSDGMLVVDLFLSRNHRLSPGERRYLGLLRQTAMRLYEVVDLSPGESVTLRDVLKDTRVKVRERLGSRSLYRHALIAARIIARGPSGQPEIEPGLLQVPELIREQTISQLSSHRESYRRKHPKAGETEFFKKMGPFFHDAWMTCLLDPPIPRLANTDGEDMVMTSIRFEVSDTQVLEATLAGAKELEREGDGKTVWTWSGKNRKGKRVIFGRLELKGQSLVLECNSVRRGERGRAMIEALAADKVRHLSTVHENIEMKVHDQLRSGHSGGRETPEVLPRGVREALVLDAQARHYREWLDDKIPALDDHTPREAAGNPALRPKLIDLIGGLEGMYQRALMNGEPAYDPSWMWSELGLADRSRTAYPPPLAHERMASMVPGLGDLCRRAAEHVRRQAGFNDTSTIVTADEVRTNLEIQRFLRDSRHPENPLHSRSEPGIDSLAAHIEYMVNFEMHRRKTFWVDESLAYMLAKTDLDAPGSDLRVPFACFALVFTDRYVLSLAERMLSMEPQCPLAGHFLHIVTVYVVQEGELSNRTLHVYFTFDALGADPPHLVAHRVPLKEDSPIRPLPEEPQPIIGTDLEVADANPLRGLLHVTLNAILYATSAGVEPRPSKKPSGDRSGSAKSRQETSTFSSEEVFFLPGAIEISRVRNFKELERISSGRSILHRFMVRGHWRRAAPGWQDQRMRWIAPYWKGPDIAAVIERTYKLKP